MIQRIIGGTLLFCMFYLTGGLVSCSNAKSAEDFVVNGVSFKMIAVQGGVFELGSWQGQADAEEDEMPSHSVTLSDFYIGETEVTQELWQAVMGSNPSGICDDLQKPVESVNWNDCQSFISKLNELTGRCFSLPTEAQWEYAARGGALSQGYIYSGSNCIDSVAWYLTNSENTTHAVKGKQPNELGLYDMSGNVSEWCSDWFEKYSLEAQTDPQGPQDGVLRVVRGGCWINEAAICRATDRTYGTPKGCGCILGLRLVLQTKDSE